MVTVVTRNEIVFRCGFLQCAFTCLSAVVAFSLAAGQVRELWQLVFVTSGNVQEMELPIRSVPFVIVAAVKFDTSLALLCEAVSC